MTSKTPSPSSLGFMLVTMTFVTTLNGIGLINGVYANEAWVVAIAAPAVLGGVWAILRTLVQLA